MMQLNISCDYCNRIFLNISFQMCTVHQTATTRHVAQPALHPVNIMPRSVIKPVFWAASVTLVSLGVQVAVCVHISVAAQTLEANTTALTQLSGYRRTVASSVSVDRPLERSTAAQTNAPEEWSASSYITRGCVNLKTPRTVPLLLGCILQRLMDIILTLETAVHIHWFKQSPV